MSPLPRLLGYSRRYKGRFVVAFAAMLLYAAASAAVAYLIKPIIDEGLQPLVHEDAVAEGARHGPGGDRALHADLDGYGGHDGPSCRVRSRSSTVAPSFRSSVATAPMRSVSL